MRFARGEGYAGYFEVLFTTPPQGNPFWSAAVRREWQLQASRPVDLPVPDWTVEEDWGGQGPEGRGGEENAGAVRDRFTTPSSWETVNGDQGYTERRPMIPETAEPQASFRGLRTQGDAPGELWP